MFSSISFTVRILFTVMVGGLLGLSAVQAAAQVCEKLSSLNLDDTTITSAQTVASGEFTRPAGPFDQHEDTLEAFKRLPAFCRVTAEIKPSKDSDIKVEVWMPVSGWNGKYLSLGNGGFAGSIIYSALASGVEHGYAM
ncbi:MAG TPA: tannase/feruloyl esterase family alpha/beta hydrolase, partial [Candidatus Angelobacter sp.]|nr:tannase/feruloyl esterase family alpha/beta hydrolase [Candidatus Angelobacter sp.]